MKGILKTIPLFLVCLLFITACQSTPTPTPNEPTPTPQPSAVTSVSVAEGSVLLENIGSSQKLTVKVLDDKGNPVNTSVTWESSKPEIVKVNADGTAEGLAVGSAVLRAKVGDKVSGPVLASVGALADGVVRIESEKIVSAPVFAEGATPFDVGTQYSVVLKDVSPSAGKLWFSKTADGFPVMGKVISSEPVADGVKVSLEIVPIGEIFKDLKVDETLELASQEIEVSEEIRANYTIEKIADGSYNFTPKSKDSVLAPAFDIGPWKCSGTMPPTTVTLGIPSFNLNTGNPTFEFTFAVPIPFVSAGSAKFLFTANPRLTVTSGTHTINANFNNLNLSCKFKNGVKQSFSAFGFNFNASLTPGITVGGSYGAGTRTFSARIDARSTIRLGFECRPPNGCTNLTQGNSGQVQGQVTLGGLGNLVGTIRDFKAGVFADVLLNVEIPLVSLDVFEFREGYEMTFDLVSLQRQISESNPADYQLRKYLRVDPFVAVKSFVSFLLGSSTANSLGLNPIEFNQLSVQSPLITAATLTLNTTTLQRNVSVTLDPNRVNFFGLASPFGLLYNVQKVRLIEVDANNVPIRTVREVTATSGQTNFTLNVPFLQPQVNTDRLHVTIVPVILQDIPVGTRDVQPGR